MPNTREKLIELLIGADDYCYDTCNEGCNVCKYNGNVDCAYNVHADHLIANGVTVQDSKVVEIDQFKQWIPVTERLPEPDVDVLCWYEYYRFGSYNRMCQTYGIGCYFRDGFWGGGVSCMVKSKVLAWMPLPQPPGE